MARVNRTEDEMQELIEITADALTADVVEDHQAQRSWMVNRTNDQWKRTARAKRLVHYCLDRPVTADG